MLRDVEMQDMSAIVADDKEAVEDAERDRGHCEEVHSRNRFSVILKKCAPTLGWPGISGRPLHPARDGSLGDVKAQHEEFRHVCEEHPRLGSPPPCGRSTPELPSTIFSYRPVFSASR